MTKLLPKTVSLSATSKHVFVNTLKKKSLVSFICFILIIIYNWATISKILDTSTTGSDATQQLPQDMVPVYKKMENSKRFKDTNSLTEKCSIYFNQLYHDDKNWQIDLESISNNKVDPLLFNRKKWLSTAYSNYKKQMQKGDRLTEEKRELIRKDYDTKISNLEKYELQLKEDTTNYRVFGKCFLNDQVEESDVVDNMCRANEDRLYPWLSHKFPKYIDDKGLKYDGSFPMYTRKELKQDGKCFLLKLKQSFNSEGIVIPLFNYNDQKSDVIGMIKILSSLGNTLPIQIIYHGEVPAEFQSELIRAYDSAVTAQISADLWFIDISPVVTDKYQHLLNNRVFFHMIATLFNSFENVIMMKPGVIPITSPNYLFNTDSYKQTQSLFFKHRAGVFRKKFEGFVRIDYSIRGLVPSKYDSLYFGIGPLELRFTNNRYLSNDHDQYMDSSVVVLNKLKYFNGLLISCNIMNYDMVSKRLGESDDEYYWIGQNIDGNNGYSLNKNFAVSVGVKTPMEKRPNYCTISQEICSPNYGQIDDDDRTLLYIKQNNKKCQNDYIYSVQLRDKFKNRDEEWILYLQNNPLAIESLLVPPTIAKPVYAEFNEPVESWKQLDMCQHEMWCGYDLVGKTDDVRTRGFIIELNDSERKKLGKLGNLWLSRNHLQ